MHSTARSRQSRDLTVLAFKALRARGVLGAVPARLLRPWGKRVEVDTGVHKGVTTSEAQRMKEMEREVTLSRRCGVSCTVAIAAVHSHETRDGLPCQEFGHDC